MSSNIEVQRICEHCSNEFIARTTVTKYCSHRCNRAAYKAKLKASKIDNSNKETRQIKNQPVEEVKAKDILSVRDVAVLLGCSVRTAYRLIENGTLKAVNLSERMTRVRRSDIDKILS
jgi:excisionase family DNA binding protein